MRIALDAMGTDSAPETEIKGVVKALQCFERDCEIILVGDQERIEAELSRHPEYPHDRISVVHAPDRIVPGEGPVSAVRKKPNSCA